MEREACVCDHGLERSDLCAEIIKIIISVLGLNLVLRPTLMHTKNLYENGPNPFFSGFFNLMGTRMVQIRMAKSGDSFCFPRRHLFVLIDSRQPPSGQSRVCQVTQLGTVGVH